MSRIQWARLEEKLVQGGLDRGVLYPVGRPALAWNGLTNVSEKGSQSSASYYIDGRKYISVVSPRDYEASLSAITFPDVFAELCGLVEVTDGLYLDSQVPDQFGLSYRTLYGGTTDYRIHLVYGATATLSDVSYATLTGDANDPTPFEFDISAVPQSLAGFRPTAHAIIDTRNIEPSILIDLENKLYGTAGQEPALPDISWLYETLHFGNTVVITNNGDGTWTAEGSYKYISVDEYTGEFVIDNIVSVDHGDGTYELSSTGDIIYDETVLDGGAPASVGADFLDGGTPTSVGPDEIDGGAV